MSGTNSVISGCGFHHVAMRVNDFDKSVAFYTNTLGFKPATTWGQGDTRAIMLDAGDGACVEIFAGGGADPDANAAMLHFCLKVDDVDAAVQRVRDAGAIITAEPQTMDVPSTPPMRVRIAFFRGPDGEVIEFFKRLALD